MLLPPADPVPFTVEVLEDPDDWQLRKLENGFKREIGEDVLTSSQQKRLQQAVKEGRITFFIAKRGYRAVGMCSAVSYTHLDVYKRQVWKQRAHQCQSGTSDRLSGWQL